MAVMAACKRLRMGDGGELPSARAGDVPKRIGRTGARGEASARVARAMLELGLKEGATRARRSPGLNRALDLMEEQALDPNRPECELSQLLMIDRQQARPFAPVLRLNPKFASASVRRSFAEVVKDHANDVTRRRRQTLFRKRVEAGEDSPLLVAEGDSWFHFPIFLRDVVQQLGDDHLVWTIGAAGEQIVSMVETDIVAGDRDYRIALREHAGSVRALLLSGGGNDIVGVDADGTRVLTRILRPYEPRRPPEWFIDTPECRRRLISIEASLRRVFADIAARHPGLPILFHGYDYALPCPFGRGDTRRPSWARRDGFLGRAMVALGFREAELRNAIVACLIDSLNEVQRKLAGGNVPSGAFDHVFHVDLRGALSARHWADELHPSDEGYAIVAGRFRQQLRALGIGPR
jgi:hypothetical protein